MIPIYEQGGGRGIGHGLDSFLARFEEICREHQAEGRATAFAFIFYDFRNQDLKRILKDEGVFAELDRLSGNDLSVFYLHIGGTKSVTRFNTTFLSALGVDQRVTPPCVVFFRLSDTGFKDVSVAVLESSNLIHGFHELYGVIERYKSAQTPPTNITSRAVRWLKSGAKFVTLEGARVAIREGFQHLPFL